VEKLDLLIKGILITPIDKQQTILKPSTRSTSNYISPYVEETTWFPNVQSLKCQRMHKQVLKKVGNSENENEFCFL
jgi:hypothetical protein